MGGFFRLPSISLAILTICWREAALICRCGTLGCSFKLSFTCGCFTHAQTLVLLLTSITHGGCSHNRHPRHPEVHPLWLGLSVFRATGNDFIIMLKICLLLFKKKLQRLFEVFKRLRQLLLFVSVLRRSFTIGRFVVFSSSENHNSSSSRKGLKSRLP